MFLDHTRVAAGAPRSNEIAGDIADYYSSGHRTRFAARISGLNTPGRCAAIGHVRDLLSVSGRELVNAGFSGDVDLAVEEDVSGTVAELRDGAYRNA
jgi:class 3 adenylate cyclase